jgi:hypothetical protein
MRHRKLLGEKNGIHNPDLLAQMMTDNAHAAVMDAAQE